MTTGIVETQYGKVQGTQDGSIQVWKGIPFAQPPLGFIRFQAPQLPEPWSGVRDATKFGSISAQPNLPEASLFGSNLTETGEDCLYLNIWSPAADDKRRPVLFWIHGGSFIGGSGSTPWYNGTAFATHGDVVVVTINYRLGVLGFSYLGELAGADKTFATNCGILDQIAALQWVRDNIAAFGGDPTNITIFGESAGAMSVGTLMAMPAAQGLFKRAILQSGACQTAISPGHATSLSQKLLSILNVDNAAALRDIPLEQIIDAQQKLSASTAGLAFRPVIDGTSLPLLPLHAVSAGSASGVATLIGTNRDEMRLFTLMDQSQAIPNETTLQQLFGAKAPDVLPTYGANTAGMTPADAWNDFLTDRTFRIPAIRVAEQQAKQDTPVWMYRFDWPTPAFVGQLRSCHALEIPFVWDNLDKPGVNAFTGDSTTRQSVANPMHAAWIAFARTGDPNTSSLPHWPTYDTNQRATMIFNDACHVEDDPQGNERRLWEGVM